MSHCSTADCLVSFLSHRLDEDESAPLAGLNGPAEQARGMDRALREVGGQAHVLHIWSRCLQAQALDPTVPNVVDVLELVLGALAGVYDDHPSFDPTWLPNELDQLSVPSKLVDGQGGTERLPAHHNIIDLRLRARRS